ncbi:hypothetical protein CC80DRAFT_141102 [Byssothecium circinans]|uniref:Uncharacterized protein n=1 Tax=Byssothecium circinans TaxID=147558 RepID=A0A6A5TX66_9PLEO|nr:hypothetical protein CC80DRAFT_141102 [Byssothecium circinans]
MASEQTFTSDLRSGAQEFKRDKNSRVKWAHGAAWGPGRRVEENRPRPARVTAAPKSNAGFNKTRTAAKNDIAFASGDSSADEDIEHPSVAPVPDAEITYSFDAERGPSHGSQILGLALTKAVERYEVRQTDKLIKDEYEVLELNAGALSPASKVARKGVAPEDEDYEFIDA